MIAVGGSNATAELAKCFQAEFGGWLLTDFARADRSVEAYALDPDELVHLLQPWVETMCRAITPWLRQIHPANAAALRTFLNHALDRVEHHCDRAEVRFAEVLLDLSPIEDLLTALSLAELGLFYQLQQNCAEGISERL